jgi:hypothetical protein
MREFPSQYGRSEQYRNPEGSLPLPAAKEIPRPTWAQPRIPLQWVGPTLIGPPNPIGNLWTVTWESPWYDLRPDLRSSQQQVKIGVPIWDRAARLYVELSGPPGPSGGFSSAGFSASSSEYAENLSLDPGQVILGAPGSFPATVPQPLPVTPSVPVNVTGTFFPGVGLVYSTQGVFSPPGTTAGGGDGYPIRYWKVRIDFSYFWPGLLPSTPPDALNLQATYY